jgi:hypothetical protein
MTDGPTRPATVPSHEYDTYERFIPELLVRMCAAIGISAGEGMNWPTMVALSVRQSQNKQA